MTEGESNQFAWDYSESSDIFNIHKKGKVTTGSAELGDFTIDFDSAGNIIGLEIMNATNFMTQLELGSPFKHLKGAELIIKQERNVTYILLKIISANAVEHVIPIPAPVMVEA